MQSCVAKIITFFYLLIFDKPIELSELLKLNEFDLILLGDINLEVSDINELIDICFLFNIFETTYWYFLYNRVVTFIFLIHLFEI